MEFQATEVQTLMDLGLNNAQAKIYFTLARFGPSNVAGLAEQLKIKPSNTYLTLLKLCELGLIEKTGKSQIKFKAVSADQTLKFLMHRKTFPQQCLPENLFSQELKTDNLKANTGIVLIPTKEQVIKKAINAVNQAQHSIDLIISWNFFSEFVSDVFPEKINPEVPKRCIIEQSLNSESLGLIKNFENESYALRYIQSKPKAMLAIFDEKEAIVLEEDIIGANNSPALWTNNQSMLTMAKNYFNNLWRKSTQKPKQERF
ncbi:MAG: TrmB family transcriptional regulator [Candidatus Bathyarchaeia archaeon]